MLEATLSHLPQVRILGRHCPPTGEAAVPLFWTAAGLEMDFTGTELTVEFSADFVDYEPWVSVELNGCWLSRFPLGRGVTRVCLFRGMSEGTVKHIRLLKDVQPMHDDPRHLLLVNRLAWEGGEFLPLPAPACRLEFIGDSITSGEGAIGAVRETDWISAFFSAENHYARFTADALGAEYRIVSQSGWGLVSSWDNDPRCTVLSIYSQLCGAATGPENLAFGAHRPNDFAAWQPDAIILNLGANDCFAMQNPPYADPATGKVFQQTATPAGYARLERACADALAQVRRTAPAAKLVWAHGMLGDESATPCLRRGIAQYRAETGDQAVYELPLPTATPETLGAREHPGLASHRAAAGVLTEFLQKIL